MSWRRINFQRKLYPIPWEWEQSPDLLVFSLFCRVFRVPTAWEQAAHLTRPRGQGRRGFTGSLPELLGVPLCRRGGGQLLGLLLAGRADAAEADGNASLASQADHVVLQFRLLCKREGLEVLGVC